jgi:ribonuclease J
LEPSGALKIVPLGGLGHIGGNMMAYETAEDLIVVDCGVLFPSDEQPGIDYVIPNIDYLAERRSKLRAFVVTHGHEDHIGALAYVLPKLPAPVYATTFTRGLLELKLAGLEDCRPQLEPLPERTPLRFGALSVEAIPVTHSIPDAVALAIDTPCGVLVHTGDFKLDPTPPDGRLTDRAAFAALGQKGVTALLSDSTNAEKAGHTWGEDVVAGTLDELIANAPFRVLVTAFASNIDRLQAVIRSSERYGRKVVLVGRSMQQNVQLALEHGYLRAKPGTLVSSDDFDKVPRSRTTVVAGGSQGEPHSAMSRIATGQHGAVRLEPHDRAIFSSRRIPGHERTVGAVINNLCRQGVEVVDDRLAHVHASGHGFNDEQREMIRLCRPRYFIPIHGEYRHLARHAALANECGVAAGNTFILEDGEPLELLRFDDDVLARRGEPVPAGLVFVDGKGVGDVEQVVLRDRRALAKTGMVLCVVIFGEDGDLVAGPDITTRGVLQEERGHALVEQAADEVRASLGRLSAHADAATRAEEVRACLRRFFRRELERRPLIVPVVMTV